MALIFSISTLAVYLPSCHAVTSSCGCLPGQQGPIGPQGIEGMKGETGDMGTRGLEGAQGLTGLRGAKGVLGNPGPRGEEAPFLWYYYPGLPGPPGPAGKCLCQNSNRNDEFLNPLQPGEYLYTDEQGNLNYLYKQFLQQFLQQHTSSKPTTSTSTTTTTTTTSTTPQTPRENDDEDFQNPDTNKFISGLFMLGPDGVLVPFKQAQLFDLFASITATATQQPRITRITSTTTTTTTTSTTPAPVKNEKIYMLGPKGSLIPFNAWGIKKPSSAFSGQGVKPTSRYSKWQRLRALLLGETLPEYDEELEARHGYYYDNDDDDEDELEQESETK